MMNTVSLLLVALLVSSATCGQAPLGSKVVRVPEHDSAIIQSHRLGGNFAYSTHEAHAYGVETPVVKQRVVPKGVTYHQGEPVVHTHTSYVKQSVPQFGVVRTQHTVPAVQYAAAPVVATHQVAAAPVQQVVTQQVASAAPVQYVQYSAGPIQYTSGAVQYASSPVHYTSGQVQYAVSPVQYITGHPGHHQLAAQNVVAA